MISRPLFRHSFSPDAWLVSRRKRLPGLGSGETGTQFSPQLPLPKNDFTCRPKARVNGQLNNRVRRWVLTKPAKASVRCGFPARGATPGALWLALNLQAHSRED